MHAEGIIFQELLKSVHTLYMKKQFFEPDKTFDDWYITQYPDGNEDHKLLILCTQFEMDYIILRDLWLNCASPGEEIDEALARLSQRMKEYNVWHEEYFTGG